MTFIWLIVWLIAGTPAVAVLGPWNDWGIGLAVCVLIDFVSAVGARSRFRYGR